MHFPETESKVGQNQTAKQQKNYDKMLLYFDFQQKHQINLFQLSYRNDPIKRPTFLSHPSNKHPGNMEGRIKMRLICPKHPFYVL